MDRLDRASRKYSLLINVDKTKVMASDGIACHVLIQNELLEQVETFPYDRIPYEVKQTVGNGSISAENMEKSQYTDINEDTTYEIASVACSNIRL